MKKVPLFLIIAMLTGCANVKSNELACRAIGITDGDTFGCLTDEKKIIKVRMLGIDAPERKQPFGNKAKQTLTKLIHQKRIRLEVSGKDRYQRTLATVWDNEQNINLEMMQLGMAWSYPRNPENQYFQVEQNARQQRVGLWQQKKPVEPQKFRKANRKKKK